MLLELGFLMEALAARLRQARERWFPKKSERPGLHSTAPAYALLVMFWSQEPHRMANILVDEFISSTVVARSTQTESILSEAAFVGRAIQGAAGQCVGMFGCQYDHKRFKVPRLMLPTHMNRFYAAREETWPRLQYRDRLDANAPAEAQFTVHVQRVH
ncbi:hypothetical protein F1559_005173 [Cyanidiococcus yangmingshanensis]|uniref:Uncharacterized protein n=1 Tax=Cyanidiococcus yangmingshanensis TaxID=2690220 RepID=A0A7J7IDV7_9RHOD|nr:hypothetical protein F1559_005173 [Cyanidiococcus yangmingshanensis]